MESANCKIDFVQLFWCHIKLWLFGHPVFIEILRRNSCTFSSYNSQSFIWERKPVPDHCSFLNKLLRTSNLSNINLTLLWRDPYHMESNPLTVVFHMVGIRHERVEVNSKDTKTMTIKAIRLFSKSYLRPCQISKTDFFAKKLHRRCLSGFYVSLFLLLLTSK